MIGYRFKKKGNNKQERISLKTVLSTAFMVKGIKKFNSLLFEFMPN